MQWKRGGNRERSSEHQLDSYQIDYPQDRIRAITCILVLCFPRLAERSFKCTPSPPISVALHITWTPGAAETQVSS